ncbi:MAG: AmmeMemoRadiSam system protein A [Firmicutes bacterium]|nr:AmmeMemoRadiSam system protein A [Bacillota bacterium]
MPLLASVVTPHPPLIIPEIGRGDERQISDTIAAMEEISKRIALLKPDTIVVVSPHTTLYADYFHVSPGEIAAGNFANFGQPQVKLRVDYDTELRGEIIEEAEKARLPLGDAGETDPNLDHGTLIPLYFIAKEWPDFKVIRLGFSGLSAETHREVGQVLAKVFARSEKRIVFVASGDLSHKLKADGPYGFVKEGPEFDQSIVEIFKQGSLQDIFGLDDRMCDKAAECGVRSFQILAGLYQGEEVESELLSYEGPFGVGYAVAYLAGIEAKKNPYIELARQSVEHYVKTGRVLNLPEDLPPELIERRAACFVTLNSQGRLRGCIGTLEPYRENLAIEIIENAVSACSKDPRFFPVQERELEDLQISVDVLSEPEKISSADKLDVKRYGVIVKSGYKSGVLLPNLDGVNTVEEQVSIAKDKAGIRANESFELWRFEVVRHEY